MYKKGFTLIELLVVIAIIGILSSVVLASLNSARAKGADAAIKSGLANMRAQAELYYDSQSPNSYSSLCTEPSGLAGMLSSVGTNAGSAASCFSSSTSWAASAALKAGGGYCVDSTGYSGTSTIEAGLSGHCL